jgi:hypothetical protein
MEPVHGGVISANPGMIHPQAADALLTATTEG